MARGRIATHVAGNRATLVDRVGSCGAWRPQRVGDDNDADEDTTHNPRDHASSGLAYGFHRFIPFWRPPGESYVTPPYRRKASVLLRA